MIRGSFVIAGASLCGATAAATLREEGFEGRITLVGMEDESPYERPPLSKEYLRGEEPAESFRVRSLEWYEQNEIELRTGIRVVQLDPRSREVVLAGGERIRSDSLLIATGSRNRKLGVAGAQLEGVLDLRVLDDSTRIREAAAGGARVVCVGMGFIGAEVAASLRSTGSDVTVVEIFQTALFRVLGPEIGHVLESIHRDNGVKMIFNDSVDRFEGDGHLERVVTNGGESIDADVAVVGIGTEPVVEIMAGTGLDQGGGIPVDATLRTEIPGVFAAGDVVSHDHPVFGPIRVEHFDNAIKMGEHAAKAMLGDRKPFDDPHWFWSDQYSSRVEMAGFAPTWAKMIVRGSLEDRSFCAFLLDRSGVIRSTVSVDRKRDVRRSFGLIRHQVAADPASLQDPEVDLRTLVPAGSVG